jgi:hypothetical protein
VAPHGGWGHSIKESRPVDKRATWLLSPWLLLLLPSRWQQCDEEWLTERNVIFSFFQEGGNRAMFAFDIVFDGGGWFTINSISAKPVL